MRMTRHQSKAISSRPIRRKHEDQRAHMAPTLPCMRGPHVNHPSKGEAGEPLGLVGRRPSGPHRLKLPRVTSLLALEGGLRRIGCIPGVALSYKYKGRG